MIGDLQVKKVKVDGDLVVRGDLQVKNLQVDGDLVVRGNRSIVEKVKIGEISNIAQLLEPHYQKLEDRLTNIEAKLEALWYAPNMPGYIEAKTDFENILKKRKISN